MTREISWGRCSQLINPAVGGRNSKSRSPAKEWQILNRDKTSMRPHRPSRSNNKALGLSPLTACGLLSARDSQREASSQSVQTQLAAVSCLGATCHSFGWLYQVDCFACGANFISCHPTEPIQLARLQHPIMWFGPKDRKRAKKLESQQSQSIALHCIASALQ